MNWRVIRALILKYAFVCSRNTFRLLDVTFWPVMDLLLWGFVTIYMMKMSNAVPGFVTFLIGAIIFWNVLYRAQQVVSVSFLDDVWSRNLLNLFVAPIRAYEYVAAGCLMGLAQALLVLILLGALAFFIDSVNLFGLGLNLGFLFVNLILMGWSMGMLTTSAVLRWGPPAEALAWALPGLLQPLSACFYPVSVLPAWLQPVALCVPASHVFEGMRQLLAGQPLDPNHVWCAFGLNVIYMTTAAFIYSASLDGARMKGFLAKYGT
jgi:ABC-2 type transport system permease protein